jgi:hypothetical protein
LRCRSVVVGQSENRKPPAHKDSREAPCGCKPGSQLQPVRPSAPAVSRGRATTNMVGRPSRTSPNATPARSSAMSSKESSSSDSRTSRRDVRRAGRDPALGVSQPEGQSAGGDPALPRREGPRDTGWPGMTWRMSPIESTTRSSLPGHPPMAAWSPEPLRRGLGSIAHARLAELGIVTMTLWATVSSSGR